MYVCMCSRLAKSVSDGLRRILCLCHNTNAKANENAPEDCRRSRARGLGSAVADVGGSSGKEPSLDREESSSLPL